MKNGLFPFLILQPISRLGIRWISKIFKYTNIRNFVNTVEPSQPSSGFKCFKTQLV